MLYYFAELSPYSTVNRAVLLVADWIGIGLLPWPLEPESSKHYACIIPASCFRLKLSTSNDVARYLRARHSNCLNRLVAIGTAPASYEPRLHLATISHLTQLIDIAGRPWKKMNWATYKQCLRTYIQNEVSRLAHDIRASQRESPVPRKILSDVLALLSNSETRTLHPDLAIEATDLGATQEDAEAALGRFNQLYLRLKDRNAL